MEFRGIKKRVGRNAGVGKDISGLSVRWTGQGGGCAMCDVESCQKCCLQAEAQVVSRFSLLQMF